MREEYPAPCLHFPQILPSSSSPLMARFKKKVTLLSGKRVTVRHSQVTFVGYEKRYGPRGAPGRGKARVPASTTAPW